VRTRRILRVLVATAGIVMVLLLTTLVLLHTRFVKDLALAQIQKFLAGHDVAIEAEDFEYSFSPLRVSAGRISIRKISSPDLPPLFQADRLAAGIRLGDLWKGRYRIDDVQLDNPSIRIVIDERHRDNIPGPSSKPATSSQPLDLLVLKLRSMGGSFTFEDRSQDFEVRLPVWDLSMDASEESDSQAFHFNTRAASVARYAAKTLTIDSVEAQGALKQRNKTLELNRLRVASALSDLDLNGVVTNLSDPLLDLSVVGDVHLKPVRQLLSIQPNLQGDMHLDAKLTGRPKELQWNGRIEGRDLTLERFQGIALDAGMAGDLGAQRARLTSIRARSPNLSASGDADIAFTSAAGESRVNARTDVADLQRLLEMFKVPVPVASRVTGNVRLRWPGVDVAKLNGTGRIQLFERSTPLAASDIPVSGVVDVNARGNRFSAVIQELVSGALRLSGEAGIQPQNRISGTLQLEVSDAAQALPQIAGWLNSGIPADFHLSGPVVINTTLDGTLDAPRIGATVEANSLRLKNQENIHLDAAAEYTREQVEVPQFSIQWDKDSITGSGRIGLTGEQPALEGQAAMTVASIQRILAAMGRPEIPVSGRLDVDAAFSGAVQSPVITAKVSGSELQAYGEPLGTLVATANLQNQIVLLDSLMLHKTGGGELRGTGRYDLTAGSYAVELMGEDLQLKGIALPQGIVVRGDATLSAQGRGTLDDPSGAMQWSSRDLHVNDEDFRSVELHADVADQRARLQVSAPFFGVSANATVGIRQPYSAEAEIRIDDADISRFPTEKLKDLSGRMTAVLNGAGDLSNVDGAMVRADVSQLKLNWQSHEITNDRPIQLSYANRELTITQATLRFNDSTTRFSGIIPLEGSSGQLTLEGRASLADIASLVPMDTPMTAQGQLLLEGKLRGNLKRLDPDLTVTVKDGSVESAGMLAPLSEANLKAVVHDGRVELEQFTGRWGAAKVTAQGEATLALLPGLPIDIPRPESPIRLSVNVDQFKLSSMTRPPPGTDGTISMRIEAQAQTPDINAVQLRVSFPDLRFNAGTFVLQQLGESNIEIRNGIASVGKFQLSGPQTSIRLAGTADLRKSGPLDIQLTGESDAAVLALFNKAAKGIGTASVNVDVRGTVQEPIVTGYMELDDGQAQLDSPRLAAENIQVRLDLNGDRIDMTRLAGTLNGGTVQGEGSMSISGPKRGAMKLDVSGDGIYMEFPHGLKTISNAQFHLNGAYPEMVISGNIDVEEGAYTEPLAVGRGLMKFFSENTTGAYIVDDSADVKDTRLDIVLRTVSPISVNNNIAQGEIDAELRLRGTIAEPGLTGKIEVDEGGRLYLRERKYSVDRGLITFNNEHAIEPVLDVAATTTVNGQASYDITMKISGDVTKKLETDLTSNPPLDEADIVSVLATGRTKDQATSQGGDVAKEQVLSFLAGDLGSSFASEAGRAIGLSQVRIDSNSIGSSSKSSSSSSSDTTSSPVDIANETDPKARLTLAKDITPQLSLIYSMNLQDSSDQIWVAEYNVTRRISTSAIMQDDNSFRVQAQHDLLFGLPGAPTKGATPVKRRIGSIQFAGDTHLSQEKLSKTAGLKTGKSYDFFSVQTARERLEKALRADDRLESRISIERNPDGTTVNLVFHITEGPQVQLVFDGWDVSDDLKSEIRTAWSNGVIDIQRIDDAQDLIESTLIKERYSGFHVESAVEAANDATKTVVFKIQPGTQYEELRAGFEGVRSIKESELQGMLQAAGFFKQGPREREQAIPAIESFYRERGFIDVKVEPPTSQLNEGSRTLTTVFRVNEGGRYHFGEVRFQGNAEFTSEELLMKIKIGPETVFQLPAATKGRQTLQELYRKAGYNDSAIQFTQVKDVDRRIVDVTFKIQEGQQRVVQEVVVEGNEKTSKGLVRSQTALEQGDILSNEKLSKARTNLYDSGAYAFVDIEIVPVEPAIPLKANQIPVRVVARVREVQPWELKYGGYLDTSRGPGVITDFSNRNMLGNARVIGMQVRYDADLSEARMYFSQPVLRRFPVKSLLSAFKSHEEQTDEKTNRTTITDKEGLSPSLEYKFRKYNTVSLGYRLEMTHQYTAVPDPLFPDSRARTAPITSSIIRDTRDDPFDASFGHFTSHAVDWGTGTLGSDLHYIKYFGQYFDYVKLGKPSLVPWTRQVRNRLLLAFGARAGLLSGAPGQDFRTEQFKTGGGTTVRGFQQDRLGPLDADGNPTGGDAELVLNSEFRFPLYKFFDGVGFVDAGNVYPTLQDFSPFDVRASYGFGVRIRTPYLLLRFDYGINMNPKPGEPRGQFFFSFGQAF